MSYAPKEGQSCPWKAGGVRAHVNLRWANRRATPAPRKRQRSRPKMGGKRDAYAALLCGVTFIRV